MTERLGAKEERHGANINTGVSDRKHDEASCCLGKERDGTFAGISNLGNCMAKGKSRRMTSSPPIKYLMLEYYALHKLVRCPCILHNFQSCKVLVHGITLCEVSQPFHSVPPLDCPLAMQHRTCDLTLGMQVAEVLCRRCFPPPAMPCINTDPIRQTVPGRRIHHSPLGITPWPADNGRLRKERESHSQFLRLLIPTGD